MGKRVAAGLILVLLAAGPAAAACRADQVELRLADGGMARFSVEVADDPEEAARGLMDRDQLARSSGMLFVYPSPRRAAFWMKNTRIPLDMIFADAGGTVTRVQAEAVPMDLTSIDGGDGVQFVLEINGGLAKAMGIGPGAVLRHPAIGQAQAAWPCSG